MGVNRSRDRQTRTLGCQQLLDRVLSPGHYWLGDRGFLFSAKAVAMGGQPDVDAACGDDRDWIGFESFAAGTCDAGGAQRAAGACGCAGREAARIAGVAFVAGSPWLARLKSLARAAHYSVRSPLITSSPRSLIFFRSVLRLRPSNCAARIWLPRVAAKQMEISGRSTSWTIRS